MTYKPSTSRSNLHCIPPSPVPGERSVKRQDNTSRSIVHGIAAPSLVLSDSTTKNKKQHGSYVATAPSNWRPNRGLFAEKLYRMLSEVAEKGFDNIVSWQPHGRSFLIKDKHAFVSNVIPIYFKQAQLRSFHRQLALHGFKRMFAAGPDKDSYYHPLFIRGCPEIVCRIGRTRVKGTGKRPKYSPSTEPDFYAMPFCCVGTENHVGRDRYCNNVHQELVSIVSDEDTLKEEEPTSGREAIILTKKEGEQYSAVEPPLETETPNLTRANSESQQQEHAEAALEEPYPLNRHGEDEGAYTGSSHPPVRTKYATTVIPPDDDVVSDIQGMASGPNNSLIFFQKIQDPSNAGVAFHGGTKKCSTAKDIQKAYCMEEEEEGDLMIGSFLDIVSDDFRLLEGLEDPPLPGYQLLDTFDSSSEGGERKYNAIPTTWGHKIQIKSPSWTESSKSSACSIVSNGNYSCDHAQDMNLSGGTIDIEQSSAFFGPVIKNSNNVELVKDHQANTTASPTASPKTGDILRFEGMSFRYID